MREYVHTHHPCDRHRSDGCIAEETRAKRKSAVELKYLRNSYSFRLNRFFCNSERI